MFSVFAVSLNREVNCSIIQFIFFLTPAFAIWQEKTLFLLKNILVFLPL